MRTTKEMLANGFGLATGLLWILCAAFVWLLPDLSLTITKWWLHGLSIEALGTFNLTFGNFLWGGVTLVIAGWVTGYVLGWSLEYFTKKK